MVDSDILRLAHAELIPWLLQGGLRGRSINETINGHCERLVALGVPLKRFMLGHFIIHPLYGDAGYAWNAASGETIRSYYPRDEPMSEEFRNSPFFHAQSNEIEFARYQLSDGTCEPEFPMFRQLRDEGVTDYCVSFQSFSRPGAVRSWDDRSAGVTVSDGVVSSYATGRISGFSDANITLISTTAPALYLAVKTKSAHELSSVLLDTYLGAHSGKRVLEGQTARGDHDVISCVVWFCDLRRSTRLADTLSLSA